MSIKHILFAFLAFGVIVLFLAGYGQSENITLPGKTVRIRYSTNLFPDVDKRDAKVAMEIWSKALNQQIGTSAIPKAVFFDDLQSLVNAADNGEIDLVSLLALDYIEIKDRVPLEPALVPLNGDETGEEKILLVRRDKGVTKIGQLKNNTLVVQTGTKGMVSLMWLDTVLLRQALPKCNTFFGTVRRVDKASQAVLPVFFNQADAAVVERHAFKTMVELNPQLNEQLTVLAHSQPLLHSISCLWRNADEPVKKAIVDTSFKLRENANGRQILNLFQIDRVVPFKRAHFDALAALVKEHHDLEARLANRR